MNCKPGDLAVMIKGQKSSGLIVRCIRLLQVGEIVNTKCGRPVRVPEPTRWLLEGFVYRGPIYGGTLLVPIADDKELRPIRDPGEDAVDETLLRIPSPSEPVT